MLTTYIKLAWRNLWKQKAFTALNVFGLTIAFASAILLGISALFDLSTDAFHVHRDRLYQAYYTIEKAEGTTIQTSHPVPFADALKTEIAGVKYLSRYANNGVVARYGDKELSLFGGYVDADYFKMFTFPVLKGNPNPLTALNEVAITEDAAKKVFGNEDPLSKTLLLTVNGNAEPFTVVSVLKQMPDASTLNRDILLRFENHAYYKDGKDAWDRTNHDVFIQLDDQVAANQFEKATTAFTTLHYQSQNETAKRDGAKPDANGQYRQIKLLPFTDYAYATPSKSAIVVSRTYPYMIATLSLLILFIACVNFINMSIGLSASRLREIGMRKTLGAARNQLFLQFWSESVFVFLFSAISGLGVAYLVFPEFKRLFRTKASFDLLSTPSVLGGFLVGFILISLIAGGYPAILMSKIGTLQSLKGKLKIGEGQKLRNSLIVVQFAIAIVLISCTLVIWNQLDYMRTRPTGFNKDQVIAFPIGGTLNERVALQRLRNNLANKPNIVSVTAADNILGRGKDGSNYSSKMGFDYKGREITTNMLNVDYDYIETLELQLIAGRSFSRQYATDTLSVVINESMAKLLGEANPVGTFINLNGDSTTKQQIVGVIKDYNFQSFRRKIEPITFMMDNNWSFNNAYVKVAPQNINASFDIVKTAWESIDPNNKFQGSFLNENLDRVYNREKTLSTLVTYGSITAIAISCLGLFAVALLMVTRRRKEIGIRKVIGASTTSLTLLLSKDFLTLVGVALVIATPIAYWLMGKWLQDYEYRIALSWWIFALAGIAAVVIAFLTVSLQTVKAALANPVKSLRTE
jgi:putative ABC transport system permease protein